jgi:uncharacterized membrane protein (UPF0127 family)
MVQVQNVTRERPLMLQGRLAANSWTRLRGLIGVRQLAEGEGLLIKPCHGVHCMFMSIPIDVVYVDRSDRVVAIDKAMKPWAVGKIYRQSAYVIELPVGAIDGSDTRPGDQLTVDYGKTGKG